MTDSGVIGRTDAVARLLTRRSSRVIQNGITAIFARSTYSSPVTFLARLPLRHSDCEPGWCRGSRKNTRNTKCESNYTPEEATRASGTDIRIESVAGKEERACGRSRQKTARMHAACIYAYGSSNAVKEYKDETENTVIRVKSGRPVQREISRLFRSGELKDFHCNDGWNAHWLLTLGCQTRIFAHNPRTHD